MGSSMSTGGLGVAHREGVVGCWQTVSVCLGGRSDLGPGDLPEAMGIRPGRSSGRGGGQKSEGPPFWMLQGGTSSRAGLLEQLIWGCARGSGGRRGGS